MQSFRQYKAIKEQIQNTRSKSHETEKCSRSDDPTRSRRHSSAGGRSQLVTPDSSSETVNQQEKDVEKAHNDSENGKRLEKEDYMVSWDGPDDPHNPKNWSTARKWRAMGIVATTGFLVGWASSIDSGAAKQAAAEFGVSDLVEALATGLYLIAFGVGSLFAAPFSETVGRNPVYLGSLTLFMIFIMASALSPNIGAQLAFRFIAGIFGCTPLTTFGGSMSDMFHPLERTYVFPVCACLSFIGPFLAPMVGAFIGQSSAVSWRWTEWTTLIMAGLITALIALFVPETYAPVLLKWKAEHIRDLTGDDRYLAEIESEKVSFFKRMVGSISRPFDMFFHEIMVILFTIYLTVVYIVLFGFLVGFEYIFEDVHKLNQGELGLCFIGMNVGFLIAFAIVPLIYRHYRRKIRQAEQQGTEVEPEQRLWYAMLGAPWLPISLFWMGWTAYPSISIWSGLVASVMFGFAVQGIFISTYQYLIDSYEAYAASALVSCTFVRYIAAGVMQVVSIPMYKNLGVHWALTLLGCLSLLMTPIPFVFYLYGEKIRSKFGKKPLHEKS